MRAAQRLFAVLVLATGVGGFTSSIQAVMANDAGDRQLNILVDDQRIATERLHGRHPNELFEPC